jgi:SAM-dependent methyltransferase
MSVRLICPVDKVLLIRVEPDKAICTECGREYPVKNNVIQMTETIDENYEGSYKNRIKYVPKNNRPWSIWPLWLIGNGYLWEVRRQVPAGSTVVELGCAGGVGFFGKEYTMIGVDLSVSSLELATDYCERIAVDAVTCIPLQDSSVDAVISSYFWEHITEKQKISLLKECQRVLKPGGRLVFLYDIETQNPLIRFYKRKDPKLYSKLFIEGDFHFGYQTSGQNFRLFSRVGLKLQNRHGYEKTVFQSPSAYIKLAEFGGMGAPIFDILGRLGRNPWVYPYTAFLRAIDTMVCPFLPRGWGRVELVVYQK